MTSETKTEPKDEAREAKLKEFKLGMINNLNDYRVLRTGEEYKNINITKPNTWIIDKSGLYLTVKNRIGEFTAKIDDEGIDDGGLFMKEKWVFYLPKLPTAIFEQIQSFFYDIADKMGNAEAYVQVYWDVREKKYVVHVPVQKVSGGSVQYDKESELYIQDFDRYILVLEIHSHNTMGAFFSTIDDSDEKETRFYGVVGKIKDPTPEYRFRFVVGEKKLSIDPEHLFEYQKTGYPAEWKENVKAFGEKTGVDSLDKPRVIKVVKTKETSYGDYDSTDWYNNYRGYGYGYYGGGYGSYTKKRYDCVPSYVKDWLDRINPEKAKTETKAEETTTETSSTESSTTNTTETTALTATDKAGSKPEKGMIRRFHKGEDVSKWDSRWSGYRGIHGDYNDYGDYPVDTNEDIRDATDSYHTAENIEDKYEAIMEFVDCMSGWQDIEMLADILEAEGWGKYLIRYLRKTSDNTEGAEERTE